MAAVQLYGDDLAAIHNAGYGFHWQGAAPTILQWLREAGITYGTVVDLGCGGGQWLARLAEEGYDPVGVDASPAMLRTARKHAPSADLVLGSCAAVDLPPCQAVTALGEPLNYLDSVRDFKQTLKSVYSSLHPGGLFVFDVRVPPHKPVETRVAARVGDDWACISLIDENPTDHQLTRKITTFRRHGRSYRRCEVVHSLQLYPQKDVRGWLRKLGFRVRKFRHYGDYRLTARQAVFVARKPAPRQR